MPISQKQMNQNQDLIEKAFRNKIKVRVTGKLIEKHSETGEWQTSTKDAPPAHKKIVWGWMGKNYGPDTKGYMRELLQGGFGEYLPEDAFNHHQRVIRTSDAHELKLEVVRESAPPKSADEMSMKELQAAAFERGLTKADIKDMDQAQLTELLSK